MVFFIRRVEFAGLFHRILLKCSPPGQDRLSDFGPTAFVFFSSCSF
jgi:hypothetical protein